MATVFLAGGEFEGSSIVADAITQVNPKHTSTITNHPVETGVSISDHIFKNNVVIDIMGEFSNNPVELVQQNLVASQTNNRDQEAWGILFKIYSEEQPLTIVSRFQVYENCFITALTPLDETDTGETLRFSMTLEQIRFASLQERAASLVVRSSNTDNVAINDSKGVKSGGKEVTSRKEQSVNQLVKTVTGEEHTGGFASLFGGE